MEKAKLTKEQAEAIKSALKEMHTPSTVIDYHCTKGTAWFQEREPLNKLNLDTLIRALYIGYEVELTEQEKINELWKSKIGAFRIGMAEALTALGREDLIPKEEKA
jgi:hypothetical protein